MTGGAPPAGAGGLLRRAVFLDRDGVVNVDHGYVGRWEDFEFVPGAVDAMRRLHEAGWLLVVVTNQSGIARGYYTEADYEALTARMKAELAAAGAPLAGVYHCPHHPAGSVARYRVECDCRKPKPGMILRAATEHGIALAESVLVGDKTSDIEAGRAAHIRRAVLIHGGSSRPRHDEAAWCVSSLMSMVPALIDSCD